MRPTSPVPLSLLLVGTLAALLMPGQPCLATEISALSQRITVDEAGTGLVEVEVTVIAPTPGRILVPLGFGGAQELQVGEQPGVAVTLEKSGGRPCLAIITDRAFPQGQTVKARYTLPGFYEWNGKKRSDFGNHTLEYRFVNSQALPIVAFVAEVLLPPAYLVNSVEDSIPELNEKTPVAPFRVVRVGERSGVRIRASKLGLGDTCMVQFRFKRNAKPVGLLLVGLAAAALYLFAFRDLIGKQPNGRGVAPGGGMAQTG